MTEKKRMEIDGSFGEGGGQILRSSLTLAMLTGQPLKMTNIRANRSKPGLLRQHLTAVEAACKISSAEVRGNEPGSSWLEFTPGRVKGGAYNFKIGTAGSTTLVLQTILPVLALADSPSTVRVSGGTDNMNAPPCDHFCRTFLPRLNDMGPAVDAQVVRHGFYPAGGGQIDVAITPCAKLSAFRLTTRSAPLEMNAYSRIANLPEAIARRELDYIAEKTGCGNTKLHFDRVPSDGPGNVVFITVKSDEIVETFTAFGELRVRAEQVAENALNEYGRYEHFGVPVGIHTADQFILLLAIAAFQGNGGGAFRTLPLSDHSTTHLELIRKFLGISPRVIEEPKGTVLVEF